MGTRRRVLVIDDSKTQACLLADMLEKLGYEAEIASDGPGGLARIKQGVDLVMLDVVMPGMDGFEVVRRIRHDPERGDVPIILVTTLDSQADRLRGVEAGADDFLTKPVDSFELQLRTAALLRMKDAQDRIKRREAELEIEVQQRTAELKQLADDLAVAQREMYQVHLQTIRRLTIAAEWKDARTSAHIERVGSFCHLLASKLELPPHEVELLTEASAMHDIGKLAIPDHILQKPDPLTEEERQIIQQHTIAGAAILGGSASELLEVARLIALTHHERWDGNGYPNGLRGEDIPLYGRICAVADVFDALTTERPYKPAYSNERACEILWEIRGSQLDARFVELFLEHIEEVKHIQEQYHEAISQVTVQPWRMPLL